MAKALLHPGGHSVEPEEPAYGFWPGTVVNIADPDKEGKIRVRVDQHYGAASDPEKIEDGDLPWARPGAFPAGAMSGAPQIPAVGAGVWVGFWGGSRSKPVWFGGFWGAGEVPVEFSSAYCPEPQTWLTKTPGGHTIEMRWKDGQSEVYITTALGVQLRLIDAPAIGGLKIVGSTPGGYEFAVDQLLKKAHLKTPFQTVEMLDNAGALTSVLNITTPGNVNVQAVGNAVVNGVASATVQSAGPTTVQSAGLLTLATAGGLTMGGIGGGPSGGATNIEGGGVENKTFAGVANWNYAALTLNATGLLALTSLLLFTLTGAGLALITTLSAITIGSLAGAKLKLCNANLIAAFNAHTHAGPATPPTVTIFPLNPNPVFDEDLILTQNVVAD